MAFFIPSSIQKRLLRYTLSHFPVIDTETLDLEQLDIAWGKRSSVELRDVGLHVKKISNLLSLPENLQPTKARILLLRITVPADIYSSGIVVEVNGIEIQARLTENNDQADNKQLEKNSDPQKHRARQPKNRDDELRRERHPGQFPDDEEEHLPTTQELAQSFLAEEPEEQRHELEVAMQSASSQYGDDSDTFSEASDEDAIGTGTGLSLPAFLANFLKGIVDRLEITISNVKFALDADLPPEETFPTGLSTVSVEFGVSAVGIEGLTRAVPAQNLSTESGSAPSEEIRARPDKRRVRLQNISGELVTDFALFASLERISTAPSPVETRSASSSNRGVEGDSISDQSSPRSSRSSQRLGHEIASSSPVSSVIHEPTNPAKLQRDRPLFADETKPETIVTCSVLSEDRNRFADASDDEEEMAMSFASRRGPVYDSQVLEDTDAAEYEEDFPFSMEESQLSESAGVEEHRLYASPNASFLLHDAIHEPDELGFSDHSIPIHIQDSYHQPHLAATAPSLQRPLDISSTQQSTRPLSRSQPISAPDRTMLFEAQLSRPPREPSPEPLSLTMSSSGSSTSSGSRGADEDLSESRIFSHEEAESMYMSAMSEVSSQGTHQLGMPGGWGRSSIASGRSENDGIRRGTSEDPSNEAYVTERDDVGCETPRAASPVSGRTEQVPSLPPDRAEFFESRPSPTANMAESSQSGMQFGEQRLDEASLNRRATATKRLLSVDEVSLWLPWAGAERETLEDPSIQMEAPAPSSHPSRHEHEQMPGAFSQYSTYSTSRRGSGRRSSSPHLRFEPSVTIEDSLATLPDEPQEPSQKASPDVELEVGTIQSSVDVSTARLLYRIFQQFLAAWAARPTPKNIQKVESKDAKVDTQAFDFKIQRLTLSFLENMPAITSDTSVSQSISFENHEALFHIGIANVAVAAQLGSSLTIASLDVGTFEFGSPSEKIIGFENKSRRPASQERRNQQKVPDISIKYKDDSIRGPEIHINTLPLHIALDTHKLDDRLACFGGVSGILDLSSSVASNSTVLAASPDYQSKAKTVRFGTPPDTTPAAILSPLKVNAKIGGLTFNLQGKACGILLQNGTMKLVVRKDKASLRIDRIKLLGPFEPNEPDRPGLAVDVSNTKFVFLMSPEEDDLTTLVSLITPSRDKYEDNDDILLDTLLRQRKKGSVLRVSISGIETRVDDIENAQRLQLLSNEISKLSSMAKYLPEDDRPGILVLASVDSVEVQAAVNESIGNILATCHQFRIAHVGLPSLLALELGSVKVGRESDDTVIDALLYLQPEDRLPMVMARMIGDEMEPTIKVKLFNLVLEYRIPTLMAILGFSGAESVGDLAASMVASVATIRAGSSHEGLERQDSTGTANSRPSIPPIHIDLLLRDCAIGLNPNKLPSKGLFLLTNARIAASTSVKENFNAKLELRKASVLLIDDIDNWDTSVEPALRPKSSETASPAMTDFCRQGFVSVATISSAEAVVNVKENEKGESLVDVNLTDRLFVLESCADSTQTLGQVLGGLAPPLPKKKEQQFRTNVVPIQDMMASFTGEAFTRPESDTIDEALNMDDADQVLEDLPTNLEFVGSFYDPDGDVNFDEHSGSPDGSSSRFSFARRTDKGSFSDNIEEHFEHSPVNTHLDISEDYLAYFNSKAPVRKWNQTASKFENIYTTQMKDCPVRVHVTVGTLIWNLYDGYDWSKTREVIAQAVEDVQARAERRRRQRQRSPVDEDEEESEIGDFLFQSIYIAIPPNRDEHDLRRQINHGVDDATSETRTVTTSIDSGETSRRPSYRRRKSRSLNLDRSRRHKISFELTEVAADILVLPAHFGETQNSIAVKVRDLEIFDHVPTSTWKKFATYWHDSGERQMNKPMIRLEILTIRPVADLAASDFIVKVNILPLRLHVDQDALDFITRFFEFKSDNVEIEPVKPAEQPFIQRIEVPTVPIKLDYKPKKVDYAGLRSGHTSEFANFFILDGAEFKLQHLICYGVQGPDRLHGMLKDIWTNDVINHQLPTVLAGLATLRPFVDVGSGIRDLVVVPMREYKKDGRLVRSIQKGAVAFARTTTGELARLGAKVAIGTQTVLEGAEGLLSPSSASPRSDAYSLRRRSGDNWDEDEYSGSPSSREERRAVSNYADQPLNVVTGLRDAWRSLERDLMTTRDAFIAIGGEVRDSESAAGVAAAVARRAPTIILRPAIGTTKAIGTALLGAGNMLDKNSRRKIEDKYKRYT